MLWKSQIRYVVPHESDVSEAEIGESEKSKLSTDLADFLLKTISIHKKQLPSGLPMQEDVYELNARGVVMTFEQWKKLILCLESIRMSPGDRVRLDSLLAEIDKEAPQLESA